MTDTCMLPSSILDAVRAKQMTHAQACIWLMVYVHEEKEVHPDNLADLMGLTRRSLYYHLKSLYQGNRLGVVRTHEDNRCIHRMRAFIPDGEQDWFSVPSSWVKGFVNDQWAYSECLLWLSIWRRSPWTVTKQEMAKSIGLSEGGSIRTYVRRLTEQGWLERRKERGKLWTYQAVISKRV